MFKLKTPFGRQSIRLYYRIVPHFFANRSRSSEKKGPAIPALHGRPLACFNAKLRKRKWRWKSRKRLNVVLSTDLPALRTIQKVVCATDPRPVRQPTTPTGLTLFYFICQTLLRLGEATTSQRSSIRLTTLRPLSFLISFNRTLASRGVEKTKPTTPIEHDSSMNRSAIDKAKNEEPIDSIFFEIGEQYGRAELQ